MSRTSIPQKDSPPPRATPVPRAVVAREAGLELIRRFNRWLIAAAVAAAGVFSLLAAHTFHGRTVTTGGGSSNSSAVSAPASSSGTSQSAGGSGLQAPPQTPAPSPAAPAPVVSGGS